MHVCPVSVQVHTFYEAVGYMIGAQTDQAVQEHLIEKYMLLPNQVWDSIIQQATKVSQQHSSRLKNKQKNDVQSGNRCRLSAERRHPEGPGDGEAAGQHPEDQRPGLQGRGSPIRHPAGPDLPGHAQRLQVPQREHLCRHSDQRYGYAHATGFSSLLAARRTDRV